MLRAAVLVHQAPPMKNCPCIKRAASKLMFCPCMQKTPCLRSTAGLSGGGNTSSPSYAGSTQVETGDGDGEGVTTDVLSTVLSAAKLVGLSTPVEAPPPAQGVWAGVSMPQPVVSVLVAPDYLLMLKRSWHHPAGQAQYNPGCRRLATGQVDPDSGRE